ncbi:MAG TPA: O-antigen ligase family protein, partial [Edaphobacter sp.]
YMGPHTLWGPLADFHVELIVAGLATIASLQGLGRSRVFSIPQTYALGGMVVSVFLSMLFAGWLGGVPGAVLSFIPNIFAFFLVIANCRRRMHLQLIIAALVLVCFVIIARGYMAMRAHDILSPYVLPPGEDSTDGVFRLRGLAFINDPNDFAQLTVSLIPCLFLFWRRSHPARNFLLVLAPALVLIFGMYLTHSRGGMLALLAVILFASRRKIGTIAAALMAAAGFAGATVVGWSGGRDVSVKAGSERLEAWSTGLQLIKSHPLFGVGYLRFNEYFYITAHNTIVVCAAELGMFGLFCWLMFVFPTIRDAYVSSIDPDARKSKEEEEVLAYAMAYGGQKREVDLRWQPAGQMATDAVQASTAVQEPAIAADMPLHLSEVEQDEERLPAEEIRRIAGLMPLCLLGYLVAGWFLSRAYVMTLFIYGGMVQVIYRWALDQNLAPAPMRLPKIAQYAAVIAVVLIALVYVMLRLEHLMGH